MKVAIIGGGPCGLYLALKLAQKDVHSVVIDPHMGSYYRPGHLNSSVFRVVESDVPVKYQAQWRKGRHIKDLERLLFNIVSDKHGVTLVKGIFTGFAKNADSRHCVSCVMQDESVEQFQADVVFDCTGGKRAVLSAATTVLPDLSWPIKAEKEPVFPHHFLYYCHLDRETERYMASAFISMDQGDYESLGDDERIAMVQDLRRFGWKHGSFPTLYTYAFGNKGKHALYCAAPENLDPSEYHGWVSTLLKYKTGRRDCVVTFLPSTIVAKEKLRRMHFAMTYERLQTLGREGDESLPSILAMGDAQIGFDYRRAHGVEDGLRRIQKLPGYVEGYKGSLEFFELKDYISSVKNDLDRHEQGLMDNWASDFRLCQRGYELLASASPSGTSSGLFSIGAKELVSNAAMALTCLSSKEKIKKLETTLGRTSRSTVDNFQDLQALFLSLSSALINLPKEYVLAHQTGAEALNQLLVHTKAEATKVFRKGQHGDAKNLYSLGAGYAMTHKNYDLAYPLFSNIIICAKKLDRLVELKEQADFCLQNLPTGDRYPLRGKIIFNLIDAAVKNQDNIELVNTALKFKDDSGIKFLDPTVQGKICLLVDELQETMLPRVSVDERYRQ